VETRRVFPRDIAYTITGVTLDNHLHLTGPMPQQATWSNWVGSVEHFSPACGT
jgi:hypothetical protein